MVGALNNGVSETTMAVSPPDLAITALSKTAKSVIQGGSFALSNTVKNMGGESSGTFEVRFVLSSNNVIGDEDDIPLATKQSASGLDAGESSTDKTTLIVPAGIPPGVYYVGAITEVDGDVAEGDEANNMRLAKDTITVTR
jgi:hypothetical protein